jgi:hypothetical protein
VAVAVAVAVAAMIVPVDMVVAEIEQIAEAWSPTRIRLRLASVKGKTADVI